MAVRPILKMGDPRLWQVAAVVEDFGVPELKMLVGDMLDTMAAVDGAGLAAPQIGVGLRVVVFGVEHNPRYPRAETVPLTVLVNPELDIVGAETDSDWEGCLSVPGMRGLVERPTSIRYRGRDLGGKPIERTADGFHARVVQHECDHLDGILYPMRIRDMRYFGFEEVLEY